MENEAFELKQFTGKRGLMETVLLLLRICCERMPVSVLLGLYDDAYERGRVFISD